MNRTAHYPVIPHANTRYFHGTADSETMYEGTLALCLRCDDVLMMPRWLESRGAVSEHESAKAAGIPVFYSLEEFVKEYGTW